MDGMTLVFLLVLSVFSFATLVLVVVGILNRRGVTQQEIEAAVSGEWVRLGLGEAIGEVRSEAEEIRKTHTTLEQMLRTPSGRGSFGEQSLETILRNHLPPDRYGIREQCIDGKTPDANIRADEKLICIDSKFPCKNFQDWLECSDEYRREKSFVRFLANVKEHLEKVAIDYVCPEKGTANFALVFIPSEAVYYALITSADGYDLLNEYAHRGVQVVSPLLLSHKIEILKTGIRAVRLNECAEEVLRSLQTLATRFSSLKKLWKHFSRHLRLLEKTAVKLDGEYSKVAREFHRIAADTAIDEERGTMSDGTDEFSTCPLSGSTPDVAQTADELMTCEGMMYDISYKGARAVVVRKGKCWLVEKGSTAANTMVSSLEDSSSWRKRDELIRSGKLREKEDGFYEFTEAMPFRKVSPLVQIVTGTTANRKILIPRRSADENGSQRA